MIGFHKWTTIMRFPESYYYDYRTAQALLNKYILDNQGVIKHKGISIWEIQDQLWYIMKKIRMDRYKKTYTDKTIDTHNKTPYP